MKAIDEIYSGYEREPSLQDLIREWGLRPPRLVLGHGRIPPAGIVVGEAPGADEARTGQPFTGISGQFLRTHLELAGISPEKLWITNVIKYRPRRNRAPDHDEIMCSRSYLLREIAEVTRDGRSVPILACGKTAAKGLLGEAISVSQKAGTMFREVNNPHAPCILVCWHPAAALRDSEAKSDFPRIMRAFAALLDKEGQRLCPGRTSPAGSTTEETGTPGGLRSTGSSSATSMTATPGTKPIKRPRREDAQ